MSGFSYFKQFLIVHIIRIRLLIFGLLVFLQCGSIFAFEYKYTPIPLDRYLEVVQSNNAQIRNASLDIQTAGANKEAQSLYRFAPSLSYFRAGLQNQVPYNTYNTPATSVYSLSFNVEGWGKRSAREKLAQAQINAISAEVTDISNDVQTNALNAYIDALRLSLMIKSYQAALDKLKPYRGNPNLADAQTFLNTEKTKTEKDMIYASLILLNFSGDALRDPPLALGNLNHSPQNVNTQNLVEQAQNNRTEVQNLLALIDVADKNVDLTMKNRNVDISPYIGQARTPQYKYTNDVSYSLPAIGPLPAQTLVSSGTTYTAQNQITVGVTIPIPITNYLQSADIVQAANQKLQFENKLRDLKVKIRVQVLQASLKYEAAKENLIDAQKEYEAAVQKTKVDSVATIMNVRDKEGAMLDSKTNHLKALIYLWRQSGNYTVPSL